MSVYSITIKMFTTGTKKQIFYRSVCSMTSKAQPGKYCMMMHRNTDVKQTEICLCLGQISLAVSGGRACGGRNGGARWRPVALKAPLHQVIKVIKSSSAIAIGSISYSQ